ncbi:GerMN domain-containing protein [Candidatus Sumerlaeota bacterium]|nr:GerMN domain-containing protein [Candidatus Sumerlaeota bacterium]
MATPPPQESWQRLFVRTLMICLAIIVVGGMALSLFFQRLGQVTAEERSRQALSALPRAIRPPQRGQLLVHIFSDGRTLHPRLESLGTSATPHSQQRALVIDRVLELAAEEAGVEVPFTTRGVYVVDGVATVDLATEPAVPPLPFRTECLLAYAIVNSLTDNFDDIHAVQFLINGEEAPVLSTALDISVPLVPNAALRGGGT